MVCTINFIYTIQSRKFIVTDHILTEHVLYRSNAFLKRLEKRNNITEPQILHIDIEKNQCLPNHTYMS